MNLSSSVVTQALHIETLESHLQHFPQVARWHHQECVRQGLTSSLASRQQRLQRHLEGSIPKTLIALRGSHLVGCVSLVNYSVSRPQVTSEIAITGPVWLSNLFVQPAWRQRGIGHRLVEAAKYYAWDLGAGELWLSANEYTDFYQKRGWEIMRRTRLGGRLVNIMRTTQR